VTAARAALLATALSIAVARVTSAAEASAAPLRVLIVVDESDDPFAERIKAEVSALGFEVVAIEPWRTGESIESLEAVGRANQAAAAIRMIASRKGVEVWIANQPTGRSLMRQLVVDERPVPNEGLVALQTAELLRTTLLSRSEMPPSAQPPGPSAVPSANPPAISTSTPGPPSASVQAAAGVLFSPGADASLQAWFSAGYVVVRPLGVALDVSVPLRSSTISGPEGSASVSAWLVGASVFVRHDWLKARSYAIAAAGGALIRLDADATTMSPLVAHSASTTAAAVYLRADGGVEATRWLHVGVRGVAGAVPQGVPVRFAGNEAAVWGRPFLAGLLLVELSWW
jgi:hypothetical protein